MSGKRKGVKATKTQEEHPNIALKEQPCHYCCCKWADFKVTHYQKFDLTLKKMETEGIKQGNESHLISCILLNND